MVGGQKFHRGKKGQIPATFWPLFKHTTFEFTTCKFLLQKYWKAKVLEGKSTGRQKFQEAKIPGDKSTGSKSSGRKKFRDAKVPGGKSSGRQKYQEAKVLKGKSSYVPLADFYIKKFW